MNQPKWQSRELDLADVAAQQQSHLKRLERLSSYVESSTITMSRTIDRLSPDDDLTADKLHKLVEELHDEIIFLRSISHHLNSPTLAASQTVRNFFDNL